MSEAMPVPEKPAPSPKPVRKAEPEAPTTEKAAEPPKTEKKELPPWLPYVGLAVLCLLVGYVFAKATTPDPMPYIRVIKESPTRSDP